MPELPTGTVTFLFTDIEGSTQLWEQHPSAARVALVRHDALVEQLVGEHHGQVVRPRGEGDSRFAVFARATDAVAAAAALQQAFHPEAWPTPTPLKVRMAVHTGEADLREGDYYGTAVNRCARLRAVAHGGQTLVSLATQGLARDALPLGMALEDLGEHRLKDLARPEHVFQLVTPTLPSDFPPLKSLDARPHNLPVQRDPLIGREREVTEVVTLLQRPDVALVTLTGPGGVGKTRLALQVAAELVDIFSDGVWFIDLAPISDPGLVASTIAHTLGLREMGGQPIEAALTMYMRNKEVLLVLDNFEQVISAASIAATMLKAASRLKVVIASREVLHLSAEREYPVLPLVLPDLRRQESVERLTQYAAVALFIQRAQAARPDFQITNTTAPAVAEICVRLDGLPLAIELAAARIKLFPPQALLARVENRLKLLTGGARDRTARQQTLRGAIDWSYQLIEPAEQALFTRLGVFTGGWTVEAAEAVCLGDGDLGLDVLDGLQSLLDKSLLRQDATEDEPRFMMLETIREYALERLVESGETPSIQEQHARFFLSLAEQAEPHLYEADQLVWMAQLVQDYDNLRTALRWGLEHPESDIGIKLAGALWRFWQLKGDWAEGGRWLRDILAHSHVPNDSPVRAKAMSAATTCDWLDGDLTTANARGAESVAISRSVGDKRGLALALIAHALALGDQGDVAARRVIEEAVELARAVGDRWVLASVLSVQGRFAMIKGERTLAQAAFEESVVLCRAVGERWRLGINLRFLAYIAQHQSNYRQAERLIDETLALAREMGNTYEVALALHEKGKIAQTLGQEVDASACYAASLGLFRDLGQMSDVAAVLVSQAGLSQLHRDWLRSAELLREALLILKHTPDATIIVQCLVGLASIAGAQRTPLRSASLLGAADVLQQSIGFVPVSDADRQAHDRTVAETRAQLDTEVFVAAWADGQAMTLERAIASALEEVPDA